MSKKSNSLPDVDAASVVPSSAVTPPQPSGVDADVGLEQGRTLARMYLPDAVRILAAVALNADSGASAHTRAVAAGRIVEVSGVAMPAMPDLQRGNGDAH